MGVPGRRGWRAGAVSLILPPLGLLLALATGAVAARAGQVQVTAGGGPRRYEASVQPGESLICVGERFLATGSDSVWLAGRALRRGRDYSVDGAQGCLLLAPSAFDSLAGPGRLVVAYRTLPLGLERLYVRRDLDSGRGSALAGGARPDRKSVV